MRNIIIIVGTTGASDEKHDYYQSALYLSSSLFYRGRYSPLIVEDIEALAALDVSTVPTVNQESAGSRSGGEDWNMRSRGERGVLGEGESARQLGALLRRSNVIILGNAATNSFARRYYSNGPAGNYRSIHTNIPI